MTCIDIDAEEVIALSTQDQRITNDNKNQFEMYGRDKDSHDNSNLWEQGW
ncbi:MAG: hypothetical protein NC208_10820 [Bacteroides sp.]|nr:hypothetical protein [Bacteroides sp.]